MASTDPYLGSIDIWPLTYAPQGWSFCMGQLLPINNNQALYALIGTTFGGDGRTTVGLPNMQGRIPVGVGQSPGGTNYVLGNTGGAETVSLNASQCALVSHTHTATVTDAVYAATATGTATPKAKTGPGAGTNTPTNNYMGPVPAGTSIYSTSTNANMGPADVSISVTLNKVNGGNVSINQNAVAVGQPHENRQPYIVLNYIIALSGTFPVRQ